MDLQSVSELIEGMLYTLGTHLEIVSRHRMKEVNLCNVLPKHS